MQPGSELSELLHAEPVELLQLELEEMDPEELLQLELEEMDPEELLFADPEELLESEIFEDTHGNVTIPELEEDDEELFLV